MPAANNQIAHYSIAPDKRMIIPVDILEAVHPPEERKQRQWVTIPMMFDTGNDTTLINYDTARRLHFNHYEKKIAVAGIDQQTNDFFRLDNQIIKLQNTRPCYIHMSIGKVMDNLIGHEDFRKAYNVRITPNELDFERIAGAQEVQPDKNTFVSNMTSWGGRFGSHY